jgi:solute carrier family 41
MEDKVRRRKMVPKVIAESSSVSSEVDLSSGTAGSVDTQRSYTNNGAIIKTDTSLTQITEDNSYNDQDTTPLLVDEETTIRDRDKDDGVEIEVQQAEETSLTIALQIFLPYIIAGFGMVGAGMVLDTVQVSIISSLGLAWLVLEWYLTQFR